MEQLDFHIFILTQQIRFKALHQCLWDLGAKRLVLLSTWLVPVPWLGSWGTEEMTEMHVGKCIEKLGPGGLCLPWWSDTRCTATIMCDVRGRDQTVFVKGLCIGSVSGCGQLNKKTAALCILKDSPVTWPELKKALRMSVSLRNWSLVIILIQSGPSSDPSTLTQGFFDSPQTMNEWGQYCYWKLRS